MTRVPVPPEMLRWACERAGYDVAHLAERLPQLPAWVRRERQPTLKQLEKLAKLTHTPLGYLFLPEPPDERLPVPDYRAAAGVAGARPSPDLLDTLYAMQRRRVWLRGSLVDSEAEPEAEPLAFVGSARVADEPGAVGREMRRALGLDGGWAAGVRTWRDAVGELRRAIEGLGVMAVINGVVGSNYVSPAQRGGVSRLRAHRSLRAADLRQRCGCEVGVGCSRSPMSWRTCCARHGGPNRIQASP